ncbi:solute carrier family 22 member 17 [Ambystoma mexicanum]|uniref:solute carrier family 22 member 17 n=1 Tax=Ambystoma mexicanum TaxID=8296 RepID=UPI0037E9555E
MDTSAPSLDMDGSMGEPEVPSLPRDYSGHSTLEPALETPAFETIMARMDGFGQHQRLQLLLSWLPNLLVAFGLFSDIFVTLTPDHQCHVDIGSLPAALRNATGDELLNATIPLRVDAEGGPSRSQCSRYFYINASMRQEGPCNHSWEYSNQPALAHNMVTQWDLVCSHYWEAPVEEVCFILGFLTGFLTLGCSADRFGRRQTFFLSLVMALFCGALCTVASSPAMFILTRFFYGAMLAGVYLSLYVLRLELCRPAQRLTVTMGAGLVMVAGQFLLLGLSVGCKEWRVLQAAITGPLAIFLLYGWPDLFLESPRWLLACQRVPEAQAVLRVLVKRNGRGFEGVRADSEDVFMELENTLQSPISGQPSITTLLNCGNIWKNLVILGFTTCIAHGIHHCYGTFRKDIQGVRAGLYLSYLLSAGTGLLACLFLWATVDRFGRRGILLLSMTLTGIASLTLLGLIEYLNEAVIMTFSILGFFASHAAASLSIFFAAEITPTVIRGRCLGLTLAMAWLGKLSSPLLDLHNQHGYFLQHVILASLAILCILSIMLLPESKRKPLPETLLDGEGYRRPPLMRGHHRRLQDNVPLLSTPNQAM